MNNKVIRLLVKNISNTNIKSVRKIQCTNGIESIVYISKFTVTSNRGKKQLP